MAKPKGKRIFPEVLYVRVDEDDRERCIVAEETEFAVAPDEGEEVTVGVYKLERTERVKKLASIRRY